MRTHDFDATLAAAGTPRLRRAAVTTLQINVGKRCNQACLHCHVDAGPKRTEIMNEAVAERLLELLGPHQGALHETDEAERVRWLTGLLRANDVRPRVMESSASGPAPLVFRPIDAEDVQAALDRLRFSGRLSL